MNNNTDFTEKNNEFDIVDFDLNEFHNNQHNEKTNPKTTKSDLKLKEKTPSTIASRIANKEKNIQDLKNNRDMLKTIVLMLIVILTACLFLGLITFFVNHLGSSNESKKVNTEHKYTRFDTTTTSPNKNNNDQPEVNNTEDKEIFEDKIDEITNNVNSDTTEATTTQATTTEINSTETSSTEVNESEETTTELDTSEDYEPESDESIEIPTEPAIESPQEAIDQ